MHFIIIIIINKKHLQCKAGYTQKTPATQYQTIETKTRKGKIVEDYSRDRVNKKAWPCS